MSLLLQCIHIQHIIVPDGAVLIHSNTGDLLRSLEPPSDNLTPRIISLTREGYIIVNFGKAGLCSYGINGKTLKHVVHNDSVQVCSEI